MSSSLPGEKVCIFATFCLKNLGVVECGFYWDFACLLVVNCGEVVVFCVVELVRKQSLFGLCHGLGHRAETEVTLYA
jgi:hypothetical protein